MFNQILTFCVFQYWRCLNQFKCLQLTQTHKFDACSRLSQTHGTIQGSYSAHSRFVGNMWLSYVDESITAPIFVLVLNFCTPIATFSASKTFLSELSAAVLTWLYSTQSRLARRYRVTSPQRPRPPRFSTGLHVVPRMTNRPSTALPAKFKSDGLAVRGGGVTSTFNWYTPLAYLHALWWWYVCIELAMPWNRWIFGF